MQEQETGDKGQGFARLVTSGDGPDLAADASGGVTLKATADLSTAVAKATCAQDDKSPIGP
jgi:hypothetical protein